MVASRTCVAALLLAASCTQSNQGYAPAQPVAFSHAMHAGERQIPCLYCHHGALRSRHAGIPETQVCMNCHAQMKEAPDGFAPVAEAHDADVPVLWVKVHRFPDHSWFSHEAHEAAAVACAECHGEVERMVRVEQARDQSMGECLDCHREPRKGLERATTDCVACHR